VTAVCVSCGAGGSGGSSGGSGSEGLPQNPQHQQTEETEYYVFLKDDIQIPIGFFPSMKNKGEVVKACNSGQSYFLDRCFDHLIVDFDNFSVVFKSGDAEQVDAISDNFIHQEYFQTLIKSNTTASGDEYHSLLPQIQHQEVSLKGGILNPIADISTDPSGILKSYDLRLHTSWGFITTTKVKHEYKLKGTAVIGGKEYDLPVKTSVLKTIYPDFRNSKRVIEGFGEFGVDSDNQTDEITRVFFIFYNRNR